MTTTAITAIIVILYLIGAPILGGILAGLDRIITARMQGRYGPPVWQPFYDVLKLMSKEKAAVNKTQNFYVFCFLLFMIFTGAVFFAGGDLLLVLFALTLASIFLVLGAFSSNSPYSFIGAERELIQTMAYEPMVLITAAGMYLATKSFFVADIAAFSTPLIYYLPGIFIGFVYILTIKFRKSPFDLSTSHHAHQELVKGLTTEFSGPTLAMIEIAHWYENIFLLGIVYLFFAFNPLLGVIVALLTYFLEILIDNSNARVTWQLTMKSAWIVAATLGMANLIIVFFKLSV
ncbi:MAG: NADH-quinone oxidoreductase subunit H [Heliobacteriaceae bacterium]|nr:NADH-quinone oxidoreductase subunit H [Heliobacteriaceae bacterium]MDD4587032.1 NADH-quinone oxidoreductase subunit H [Heliobacteriaceae bacterium]